MMLEHPFLRWVDWIYGLFVKAGSNLQSLLLLYMRLTWGHQLFMVGMNKLKDVEGTMQFFAKLNIPAPAFHVYEVGMIEVIGGALLFIGFASRLVSVPILIVMFTALSTAHAEYLSNLRFITEPHMLVIQDPYPFLITALMVFVFGPGRISLDGWIKRWSDRQPKY